MRVVQPTSLFLSCGIALAACAQPPQASSVRVDRPVSSAASSPLAPPATAAELRERFFTLARGLHARGDTDARHVEDVMGVELAPDPESNGKRIFLGRVKEGWTYWIYVWTTDKDSVPDLRMGFAKQGIYEGNCAYDLDTLSAGLVRAGFKGADMPFPTGKRSWLFSKDVSESGAGFSVQLFTLFADQDAVGSDLRECVNMIKIGYGELR